MFGHFNQEELTAAVQHKITAYRQEAALQRPLPRYSIRYQIAQQLRAWAEVLEPSTSPSCAHRRLRMV
jgi:hypothetical protein